MAFKWYAIVDVHVRFEANMWLYAVCVSGIKWCTIALYNIPLCFRCLHKMKMVNCIFFFVCTLYKEMAISHTKMLQHTE